MTKFDLSFDSMVYIFKFRGTVILRIFWIVLIYLLYVTGIILIHNHYQKLGIFNNIVGVLGIIIGLLLGFRSSNSISRYNEGRNAFVSLKKSIRNMAMTVWIHVPVDTPQDLVEKKTIINLLSGYCFALKHYLREEYSYDEPDMENYIKFLPKFVNRPTTIEKRKILNTFDRFVACDFKPPTNIPQEIIYCLSLYSKYVKGKHPEINGFHWLGFELGISGLESMLTSLESLQRTPMPVCYASHLEHSFWIYLILLPFQILESLGWWTLPILGFSFFFFTGVMAISLELEDPFGYDHNDLPLDDYCWVIRHELNQITGSQEPENTEEWTLSPENFPLAPHSPISAPQWSDKSMEEAQNVLFNVRFKSFRKTRDEWNPKKQPPAPKVEEAESMAQGIGEESV